MIVHEKQSMLGCSSKKSTKVDSTRSRHFQREEVSRIFQYITAVLSLWEKNSLFILRMSGWIWHCEPPTTRQDSLTLLIQTVLTCSPLLVVSASLDRSHLPFYRLMGYLTEAFCSQQKSNERRCWYLTETRDFHFSGGNDLATLKSEPLQVLQSCKNAPLTPVCTLPNLLQCSHTVRGRGLTQKNLVSHCVTFCHALLTLATAGVREAPCLYQQTI